MVPLHPSGLGESFEDWNTLLLGINRRAKLWMNAASGIPCRFYG